MAPAEDARDDDAESSAEADEAGDDGGEEGDAADEPLAVSIDEGALYVVVREAVEDALLGVIGTLLLVGVALVLVWVGGAMAFNAGGRQPAAAVAGLAIALIGIYLAASSLEVIPPFHEWF
jgi:hypothetical protein